MTKVVIESVLLVLERDVSELVHFLTALRDLENNSFPFKEGRGDSERGIPFSFHLWVITGYWLEYALGKNLENIKGVGEIFYSAIYFESKCSIVAQ